MLPGNCQHSCARCSTCFECFRNCGLAYFDRLCATCIREGYQLAECKHCKELKPLRDDRWGCDNCVKVKVA